LPPQKHSESLTFDEESLDTEALRNEFHQAVNQHGIRNAMSLEKSLNPANEDEFTQEFLFDDDILELAQVNDNEDSDQESAEQDVPRLFYNLSAQEKVTALTKAVAIIGATDRLDAVADLSEGLRKVQRKLRWEIMDANKLKFTQSCITQFFS
jgi:hypothetical protein